MPTQEVVFTHVFAESATLYLSPVEADRVTHVIAGEERESSNLVGFSVRGNDAAIIGEEGDWLQVQLLGSARAWVKRSTILSARRIIQATVLEDMPLYVAPNERSRVTGRSLPVGSYLLVTEIGDDFSKVNIPGNETFYLPNNMVATGENDVEVSKLIHRVRWSDTHGHPFAPYYSTVAKGQDKYPSSSLLATLAQEAASADGNALAE